MTTSSQATARVAIIGGGPAGLMAAEVLVEHGLQVAVYEAMPSVGRKFLLAGVGGLNITHSEASDLFLSRYAERSAELGPWLAAFDGSAVRAWAQGLGVETFVGSSGRVFPREMKAAPLLRAWLSRLRAAGVSFHVRHRWQGWNASGQPYLTSPHGEQLLSADVVLLALGGGSWQKFGSDGAWWPWLQQRGIALSPLQAANCGFDADWSPHFADKFAGTPLKSVRLSCTGPSGQSLQRAGEFVITASGVEGSLIYAAAALLRDSISAHGSTLAYLDLLPDRSADWVHAAVTHPRGSRSLSSHLQSRLGLKGVKVGLLHECLSKQQFNDMAELARAIKALPLRLLRPRPLDEAISTAGGVSFAALDEHLMLKALPGVFCAGEMLDWEAPTGGYLLTACLATGRVAAQGVVHWLQAQGQMESRQA
ncbi:TIGR03862 family flavoprotein [Neisseriaceae bacterium TC5R-5]|nr:TIGR03862 family flavoprotein [Neisseriaceae bacterium TC5R-5]